MFADEVLSWTHTVLFTAVFLIQGIAIVLCALQRADGFVAIGTLSKPMWLGVLFGTLLLGLLFMKYSPTITLVAVTGAIVYLVDVRPAIRDIGSNSW